MSHITHVYFNVIYNKLLIEDLCPTNDAHFLSFPLKINVFLLFFLLQGRCNREKPPCKYFHPPQHLKDQLLINGRNHLALKNALMQQMGITPGQTVLQGQCPVVSIIVTSTFFIYFSSFLQYFLLLFYVYLQSKLITLILNIYFNLLLYYRMKYILRTRCMCFKLIFYITTFFVYLLLKIYKKLYLSLKNSFDIGYRPSLTVIELDM